MKHIKMVASVLCLAALAACNSDGLKQMQAGAPTVEQSLGDADNLLRAGQKEQAINVLKKAASDHPNDKASVLRIAQVRFDEGNYGDAIVYANETLRREPDNLLASSIVAVSGLRVASKALGDLSTRNNLTGNVRDEARELADLLRTALNADGPLVPARKPAAAPPRIKTTASNPPAKAGSDPFGSLK